MEARVFGKPGLHLRMFVGRVVVGDQMEGVVLGRFAIDLPQKTQPLLMTMALHALTDDGAIERIQRCEQGRHAIALVVVSHGLGATALER